MAKKDKPTIFKVSAFALGVSTLDCQEITQVSGGYEVVYKPKGKTRLWRRFIPIADVHFVIPEGQDLKIGVREEVPLGRTVSGSVTSLANGFLRVDSEEGPFILNPSLCRVEAQIIQEEAAASAPEKKAPKVKDRESKKEPKEKPAPEKKTAGGKSW